MYSRFPSLISLTWRITAFFAAFAACSCSSEPQTITPAQALNSPPVYDYPINNPYAATIITVPPAMKVDYSKVPKPSDRELTIFKGRRIPEGFWYYDTLKYSQLLQSGPAPLVYVIAGTGADSGAETMRIIADILYSGGFSVVLLPSPTHEDFIINASENYVPGRPSQDAKDLYRVMNLIDRRLSGEAKVTGHMLIGYSLGAVDALFTAKLDDEQKNLNFSKVMLINPPLSLYNSVQVIDKMLYRALPNGMNSADRFVRGTIARLSSMNQSTDALDFSNERLLIEAYNTYKPDDARLATLIGLSFRLAAANMIFTADVMGHDNYIFPRNAELRTSTPLEGYLSVAMRTSFKNYFDEIYTEKYMQSQPGLTRQDLINESNLQNMSGYIAQHPKIGMITNRDDIILAPGDVAKLVALFGRNATVYPNGGHLGNLGTPAVAYHIVQFMKD